MRGLRVQLRRDGEGGFDCLVTIGDITIGAASDDEDPRAALNAATGLANDLLKVVEQNPALAVLIPPQATAALTALRFAAAAARSGRLDKVPAAAANAVRSILRSII